MTSIIAIILLLLCVALPIYYGNVTECFGNYGSKCYSCEEQDRYLNAPRRSYGSKCFSCEN
jgi:hypothetical protein